MRLAAILLTTVALACGSTPGAEDGQGGEPGDSSASGGRTTGAASGDGDSGGSPGTGGESTGGTDTGGTNTGGNSTGGAEATGGSGTGGAPSACSPPPITMGVGSGDDLNNVCGWTTESAPSDYPASRKIALDCANLPTGMIRHLASDDPTDVANWGGGIWRTPYVSVIDSADTCETGEMDGADRKYSFSGQHCMKISSPFAGFQVGTSPDPSGCVLATSPGEVEVTLGEPGWVRVDVAVLESGTCPLACN